MYYVEEMCSCIVFAFCFLKLAAVKMNKYAKSVLRYEGLLLLQMYRMYFPIKESSLTFC